MKKKRIILGCIILILIIGGLGCYKLHSYYISSPGDGYSLAKAAISSDWSYFILDKDYSDFDKLQSVGIVEKFSLGNYVLLKNTKTYDNFYIVTQYASQSGGQSLIYSITDCYGHLILIDGGWDSDADQLRAIIDANGGKVDVWILTHPHEDHIWAFNTIFEADANAYEVDAIYVSDFNETQYLSEAAEWDNSWVYEDFLKIEKNMSNITEVQAGDEFDVCGLDMKVLNSYSNKVAGTDAANDGSMMFKLSAKDQSMLFCADVGVGMSDTLIDQWGDELKADYIQMGHHGNGGLSEAFYRLVDPSVAFFDAPDWLMYPADGISYTTPENESIMENMGCTIYSYNTAPNQVILK